MRLAFCYQCHMNLRMYYGPFQVHERSVESDLALECLHLLMAGNKALRNLKLVLMSATADIDSFKRHFA